MRIPICVLLIVLLASCTQKSGSSSTKNTSTTPSAPVTNPVTPPVGGPGPTTGCYANGVGTEAQNYYTLPQIVFHGAKRTSGNFSYHWSSADDPSFSSMQNLFSTDTRFNIRVLIKSGPSRSTKDNYNVTCNNAPLPYAKLKVKVGLRVQGATSYYSQREFDVTDVDSCTGVHEFNVPSTSFPLIVDIMSVAWDYTCKYFYKGYETSPSAAYACPLETIGGYWGNDCLGVELQMATDYTKDIPH
jgi:hypothetical protein